jgi:cardiolipin synthase
MFATIITLALVLLEGFAFWFAYLAITSARTPQGSVGWVVFLIVIPWLAVPLYLILGHSRFDGYVNARRDSARLIEGLIGVQAVNAPKTPPADSFAHGFAKLAEVPLVSGNSVDLLVDGRQTFDAIFAAVEAAENYILVQFYIFTDDVLGNEFKSRLIAKARDGISVRLLYDAVGCGKLPRSYLADMREAGIEVHDVYALRSRSHRFKVNFRNHRKIVITDGTLAFTGGLNVGDEYMGRDPRFGPWRDTHCAIRGPMTTQLQVIFAEDWIWATKQVLEHDLNWKSGRAEQDADGLILACGPGDYMETGTLYFCNAIGAARERIWIASPYFVPDTDILTALKLAAVRGVDVRILVPEMIDHKIVWLAAFAYFDEVRAAGIEIWRYNEGFMHQKVLVVDDAIASIGTINLDNRSCRLNFEVTAMFFDASVAGKVASMLEADFARSSLLTKTLSEQPRHIRVGAPIARLFAPVL